MTDYPKLMFRGGEEITVSGSTEEAAKAAEGYAPAPSAVAADACEQAEVAVQSDDEPEPVDEPTFGPPSDQTHAKRPVKGGKKK